eukprot:TRINITY_DN14563_c0_g1_i4.p1 TRINITY_DN14563_c0_g1~~TRINITY_DN14563_c0_g1_i4.p1  ORF type:complete len:149 (-),score=42.75 TRINITY_DN14563_c0_g1_i4:40-486(-)
MIRRPPRSTLSSSSAASDVYKRQVPYKPNATWCPWNFYRTSGDVRATYASVIGNLATAINYANQNLSTPGCWAYPDMLEVGCQHGPGGAGDPGLSPAETKSHFASWAIVSSPLTLSHLSLIHISEPTRLLSISYAVFCLKKKKKKNKT